MADRLFQQNVVACIWDFDLTLSPSYMQAPLFAAYGIDEARFWREVRALSRHYRDAGLAHLADDTMYLNHLLTYAQAGLLPGCDNARLQDLGAGIEFFPGLPEAFPTLAAQVAAQHPDVELEHYVISNGLAAMIRGSAVAPHVRDIWGCEFIEQVAPPGYLDADAPVASDHEPLIRQVGYVIDNTTKTRAIFEINKGSNVAPQIGVNDAISRDSRRVPFEHMIYIADGPSDIPVFSLVGQNGGRTCAVYNPGDRESFAKANGLLRQERVEIVCPADYRPESQLWFWLSEAVDEVAAAIDRRRAERVAASVRKPPASY